MKSAKRLIAVPVSLTGACFLLSIPAGAHPGHLGHESLISGFAHPLGGLDHMFTMLAIGVLASLHGARARLAVPAAFLTFMVAGALLGMNGLALPHADSAITILCLIIGGMLILGYRLDLGHLVSFASVVAACHGSAHGTELAPGADALLYCLGFAASTALLLATGTVIGSALRRDRGRSDQNSHSPFSGG